MNTPTRRTPVVGRFQPEEVALANRNSGMPLEALRYDVTPVGMHYLLIHFDIPEGDADTWVLEIGGLVQRPLRLGLADLRALPQKTLRVTLECAGNGRAQFSPRNPSMPWGEEGASTAEWTGTPLAAVLEAAGVRPGAVEWVISGTDRGIDRGIEHDYARSLTIEEARREDILLVHAMNGQPLLPQHGAPLRLIVPGWYGMASVKWLARIEAVGEPFGGVQQKLSYHFRQDVGDAGVPCTEIRVNALMVPPGIPDFYTRRRIVEAGTHTLRGRAWSGGGTPIRSVEVGIDGHWTPAQLDPAPESPWAWRGWQFDWQALPGEHTLACRATDASGAVQPLDPVWDIGGFGNNSVQRVQVTVR